MTILMGPILSFRGCEANSWGLSALVVTNGNPATFTIGAAGGQAIEPTLLWENGKKKAYRYNFASTLGSLVSTLSYFVDGNKFEVAVPGAQSPRMAYASCNGFSSLKDMKHVSEKNHLWGKMRVKLETDAPYHIILLGGDQVYADGLWELVPSIKTWNEYSIKKGNKAKFTERMKAEIEDFYFNLYTERWSQPEIAYMLARVPMIAMWDDHDLFDGWGSYPSDRQQCEVFQGIGDAARKAFMVFQQQLSNGEVRNGAIASSCGFSFGYKVGKVAILAMDMRSERTGERVLSPEHWGEVYRWLDELDSIDHLIVMSSIPVVYPGFDTLEQLLGAMPGYQDLEDDLRDHWNSRPHKGERIRLIHRLFKFTEERQIRPTIISGDVHVAAVGVLENSRLSVERPLVINQLISSGIVHPSPNAVILFCLKHIFDSSDEVDRGIVARITEFPGNTAKFVGHRNFLSLEPDPEGRIWANWIVEGEHYPYTKVIHPLNWEEKSSVKMAETVAA